jgi:enamine deaminase RidA (YjgF/YER057c/UK114 family)
MSKRVVYGKRMQQHLAAPIGPFSHGIVATGRQIVFIAGQVAWDADGKIVGKGDLAKQYVQVMENIRAIIEDAGGTMNDICKFVNYVTGEVLTKDAAAYAELSAARRRYIESDFPVSTLVEVSSLMDPDALIEVDAIAVLS